MRLVGEDVAGNPVTGEFWVRRSLRALATALRRQGESLSPATIRRVLLGAKIRAKSNIKHLTPKPHPDRDLQFRYLLQQRRLFEKRGDPIISVDTKKKELIGRFSRHGKTWTKCGHETNTHDFPQDADAKLVPYGVYDVQQNLGYVFAGISHGTPDFAVDAIVWWWREHGQKTYPDRRRLLILCDSGGSNGYRVRRWKFRLFTLLCVEFRLKVTVCHFPPGASKWNPVEHRLFSQISATWAGMPLTSVELAVAAIRATKTKTGMRVFARVSLQEYPKKLKVTATEFSGICLRRRLVCPNWNYEFNPRKSGKLFLNTS